MGATLGAEICVIGGGPAGSTIAHRLALLGHDVCLVEREAFPRPHVGESLPPGILPVLDALGLRERVEGAGFLRPEGALVRWSSTAVLLREHSGSAGFQVDRGRFDHLLLDEAVRSGVRVIQPAEAGRPARGGPCGWRVPLRHAGVSLNVNTAFVVDASGRRGCLAARRSRTSQPTAALYAYWRGARLEGPETRVEAGTDEWFWGAPLPDGTFNATVFVDPRRCAAAGPAGIGLLYRSLLAGSTLLRGCLDGTLLGHVRACGASCYRDEAPVGDAFLKVGEASFTIDPLSSVGVQEAMCSGFQGSRVVHTILTRPGDAPAARAFYGERQAESSERHRLRAGGFYAEANDSASRPFWRSRALAPLGRADPVSRLPGPPPGAGSRVRLAADARLVPTPVLDGPLIRLARALDLPALERPVAYLGGVEIAPLLETVVDGETATDLLMRWSPHLGVATSLRVLHWLWEHQAIVASPAGAGDAAVR